MWYLLARCAAKEEVRKAIIGKDIGLESFLLGVLARDDSRHLKTVELSRGDNAVMQITDVRGHTLKGQA